MAKHVITIDPGSESTGVAVWTDGIDHPSETFLLTPESRQPDVFIRTHGLVVQLNQILNDLATRGRIDLVVCEFPEVFMSAGSVAAAQSGSLLKLAYVCGAYGTLTALNGIKFQPVPVREWKGNLSKNQVIRRIRRTLGNAICASYKNDEWDAVGIGLWYRGRM